MRRIVVFLVVGALALLLIFSGCTRPPVQTELGPGNYSFSVVENGLTRPYFIHVPKAYVPNSPAALVLNFHGGGGSPEGHREITGMDATADKHGFIVVYPRGTRPDGDPSKVLQRFWNVKPGPTGEFNSASTISARDDEAYVAAILADVEKKFSIDETRVFATGFSNGAIFSNQLACDLSDRFAAIAPVGAPLWMDPKDCSPSHPVSVIYFHGTTDPCAPFEGGTSGCELGLANSGRIFPSAQSVVDAWKQINAAGDDAVKTFEKGAVLCETFLGAEGSEVTFCKITGGGHTWPGGKPYVLPGFDVGVTNQDISANELMWDFFKKHPLQ